MENLLSPQRVAEILDCKRGHVYKLIRDGRLQAQTFGPRLVRISESSLQAYRDAHRAPVAGDAITGNVYFVDCGRFTKIGFTAEKDWRRRIDGLKTSNPEPLQPWAIIPGSFAMEREIHAALDAFRKDGEWFDLSGAGKAAATAIVRAKNGSMLNEAANG